LPRVEATAAETVADQAQTAFSVFAGGLSQQDYLSARYGQVMFADVDGKWARLNGPDPKTGIESYGADTERQCKAGTVVSIASKGPLSLSLTTSLEKGSFTQTYTLIAGSTFSEHTEVLPYLTAIGLGPDKVSAAADQQRALALSIANGLMQIYRPSPDVLVMTRDRGYPLILARCPAA
jgi:hypothetical protein